MRFKDQVAVITGSGRGIGRAVALHIAKEGGKVVINDLDETAAQSVVEEIKTLGGDATAAIVNVAEPKGADQLIEHAVKIFGTVHILINNAALIRPAMIDKMTDEQWDLVIDVGLKGVFNTTRAVAPIFKQRAKDNPDALSNGKVINMTSTAGLAGTIGQINYAAAKSGVIGMTMSTAKEWGKYRVQSNAIAFGVVETRMTETIRSKEKLTEIYKERIPLKRFATTEDVTPGILFLSSYESDYITGHVLNVSGGSHIGF